ncbi:hypothetical protein AKJ18_33130, partial [Vibrio xuii]
MKEKGSFPITATALAVAAIVSPVVSQAQETSTFDEMVVVSSRMPKAISDIPGTVWYIDSAT